MQELWPLLLIVIFLISGTAMTIWTFSRSREILEKWARDNGYELIMSEFRWLRRGRFLWTSSKGQMLYYVKVQTPEEQIRSGWVRCGSFWWGLLSEKAEVRWED